MTYNDMYLDYWCQPFPYDYPYSFEEHNKIYLQGKIIPYWIWNEFDTVTITFNIPNLIKCCRCYPELNFEDIDPQTHYFEITFYNFRYEELYSVQKDITEEVSVEILKEDSEKYFPSGVYYCSLILKSLEDDSAEAVRTIVNKEYCLLYVR